MVTTPDTPGKPLRLWPGIAAVVAMLLLRFGLPLVWPDGWLFALLGSLVFVVAIFVWWLFFSRAPWRERLWIFGAMVAALAVSRLAAHPSIRTGAMGMLHPMLAIPTVAVAFAAVVTLTSKLSARTRRAASVGAILASAGIWALVRTGGFTGDFRHDLHWRWSPTAEERLLAQAPLKPAMPTTPPAAAVTVAPEAKPAAKVEAPAAATAPSTSPAAVEPPETPAIWPGFRGPRRDGVQAKTRIGTDWSSDPPVELWRKPIGPGWSSFAVDGDRIYTQEQRGPEEIVACYRLRTGEPIWVHGDPVRFYESNGGPGPRGTPTLSRGRVYTFGATGVLNALDSGTGALLWSRNPAAEHKVATPGWGFSSSPVVMGKDVIVAPTGLLAAYDAATGTPRWATTRTGGGYSSPHVATLAGVPQILLLSGRGIVSVSPSDGKVLWSHDWRGMPIVQPAVTPDGDVLLAVADQSGIRRLAVERGAGGWTVKERWTSNGLKPYFNDFVVHKGHAYGFDGSILSCINLEDGKRKWKGGRYGHGQMLLLADQDLLLVLSEDGEVALVRATADEFAELARFKAIEGKTWNHPVVAADVLLARNGEEMGAFRLPAANGGGPGVARK